MTDLRTKPDTGTAHTPGEWTVSRSKMATDGAFDYAISADGAPVIAEAFGRDAKGGWPNAEANARLIAAAPDMLAALKDAHGHLEHMAKFIANQKLGYSFESLGEDIGNIRDAISKAEGRQS